ncbi:DNA-processing protein DprA [Pseudooceanicola sp. CBS1P-1]|uniref:DNA-protecting protein DprA n=1 Tax=Pseudooceanicola albus TaxID=2692189 RepID=A0A6L7G1E5_9RHOB|nr:MULTISPECIES: DNA-processing protein DprA [Pseudooceanicola]MBT9382689.1 DNA-processing protein DprA [Pseudooceanicola endophyticus]MXN17227.1 DNA-protecting protein DprA [Pseudooceanicola albus]
MVVGTHPSTHPPLPPTTEDARLACLRLLRSRRVGTATFFRLISEHGTAAEALAALPQVARAAGLDSYSPCPAAVAEKEMRDGQRLGARLLVHGAPDYPKSLMDLDDPPPLLWALGDLTLLGRPAIGLVGARNASSLALRMARRLAADLGAAGHVTVSGLARGIDAAVHEASLETGTIAVQAGGVDTVYPLENADLAAGIAARGLRLSEQPIGQPPAARHFPLRNRIISGLARAVVVVEAAAKSGSLITARNALDQGREVMAVPGHPFDARASGCNLLLRDGATLVRGASDVLEALGQPAPPAPAQSALPLPDPTPPRRSLNETALLHRQILDRLGPSPMEEDRLIRDIEAPAQDVGPALTELELEGLIERQPGGRILRLP